MSTNTNLGRISLRKTNPIIIIATIATAFMILVQPVAQACTGIMLKNSDKTYVHGRTLEFGYYLDPSILFTPRGNVVKGNTPSGKGKGMVFTTKYATMGMISFGEAGYIDGINEKGLSLGTFYFPSYAKYAKETNNNRAKALSASQFGDWILGNFATVAEVRKAVEAKKAVIVPTLIKGYGDEAPPVKYVVYDLKGNSIVIEPLNGELVITNNPLGSMANSPTHAWHLTNLRNYISLGAYNVNELKLDRLKLQQIGQGNGMLGLPGDFTPPSRFVRATVFSVTATPSKTSREGVNQVFHILNNFDIPVGVAKEKHDGKIYSDYTVITVAREPNKMRYYWKTYEDQTIKVADMTKFDLNGDKPLVVGTESVQPIYDSSGDFQPFAANTKK